MVRPDLEVKVRVSMRAGGNLCMNESIVPLIHLTNTNLNSISHGVYSFFFVDLTLEISSKTPDEFDESNTSKMN